jgi:hypothetical protein
MYGFLEQESVDYRLRTHPLPRGGTDSMPLRSVFFTYLASEITRTETNQTRQHDKLRVFLDVSVVGCLTTETKRASVHIYLFRITWIIEEYWQSNTPVTKLRKAVCSSIARIECGRRIFRREDYERVEKSYYPCLVT